MKNNILQKNHSFFNNDINLIEKKESSSKNSKKSKESLKNNKCKNISNTLEILIKEEIQNFKIPSKKKEKLKYINLYEKSMPDIYEWGKLINNSIPIKRYTSDKRDNIKINLKTHNSKIILRNNKNKIKENKLLRTFNADNNKKQYSIDVKSNNNKTNYNNIDYSKGMNVICELPNEFLNNYYEKIEEKRKAAPELSPKIKLKNNNLQNEIKIQRVLAFNKEIKLNILLSNELNNKNNFKNEDLIIVAKRKNADVLIKSYYKNKDKKNKRYLNVKSQDNFNNNNKNEFRKKNKGLILSSYDENNLYIKIFNEAISKMCEQNKITDKDDIEVIKPTLRRNFVSDFNLNINNNFINYDISNENKYDFNEKKNYRNKNNISKVQTLNNFFKNCKTPRNNDYARNMDIQKEKINESKVKTNILKRPMSSYNIKSNFHNEYGFNKIILNENKDENNFSDEQKASNLIKSFPQKSITKVGNNIYDRINKMIKSKKNLKLKFNNKQYNKVYSKEKEYNSYENSEEEESKNHKIIPKYNYNDLKNNEKDKKIKYNFFEENYKYEKLKKVKIFDTKLLLNNIKKHFSKNHFNVYNKKGNNIYSSSNNYIVNNKRKIKNKYLKDYSDSLSLDEVLAEILFGDK